MVLSNNAASFALAIAIAATFGIAFQPDAHTPESLLAGLAQLAAQPRAGLSVALGYNVCVDAIVPARDVLTFTAPTVAAPETGTLLTEAAVDATFMSFFSAGAAAERSCEPSVFQAVVARATASTALRRHLGGNAALMASNLAGLGVRVLLGGHIGPQAAKMLPPSVALASKPMGEDEVHLILEYERGEVLGPAPGVTASRANRFIVTADEANTNVDALIATIKAADKAGSHALVVAGLHMLEPLPPAKRNAALSSLVLALSMRKGSYVVHVEVASSAEPEWMASVARALFPLVDSVGFNEQEAAFLYEAVGGTWGGEAGERKDVAGSFPRAVPVASLLRFLLETFPNLSRLHFHSLAMHVTAHAEGGRAKWRGGVGPVAAGSTTASTSACRLNVAELVAVSEGGSKLYSTSAVRYNLADPRATGTATGRVSPGAPVLSWSWSTTRPGGGGVAFSLAPVMACAKPASTVGLGDAISAAGLAADVLA
jgi:ADP-dependent glucokinase